MPLTERVWVSLFQSVTPRTAGFNTADLTLLSEVGQMLIIMLMLIGGSPGSTAGGMKTTTLAVLVSSALSVFRKKEHTHFFGRQIPDGTIRNAATIFFDVYRFIPCRRNGNLQNRRYSTYDRFV